MTDCYPWGSRGREGAKQRRAGAAGVRAPPAAGAARELAGGHAGRHSGGAGGQRAPPAGLPRGPLRRRRLRRGRRRARQGAARHRRAAARAVGDAGTSRRFTGFQQQQRHHDSRTERQTTVGLKMQDLACCDALCDPAVLWVKGHAS